MLDLIQTGWQDCWESVWGPFLFFVLPIGLLATTHLAFFELRFRYYRFPRALFLACIPYAFVWLYLSLISTIEYSPDSIKVYILVLALCVFLIGGPVVSRYAVKRTLDCSDADSYKFAKHWSVANVLLGILILVVIPPY